MPELAGDPTQTQTHTRLALALLWLVPLLWVVDYIVARKAPGVIDPYLLAVGRWALAALVLVVMAWAELWRGSGGNTWFLVLWAC